MKSKLIIIIFVLTPSLLFSQQKWSILFGTEEFTGLIKKNLPEDLPQKIVQNKDGDYYISGTNNYSDGNPKPNSTGAWIAKFSSDGKFQWFQVGNPNFYQFAPDQLTALSDGGAVVIGVERNIGPTANSDQLILYKYSKTGELQKKEHTPNSLSANGSKAARIGMPLYTWENTDGNISSIVCISARTNGKINNEIWLLNFTQNLDFVNATVLNIENITITPNDFGVFAKFDANSSKDGSFNIIRKDKENRKLFTIFKFDKNGKKVWSTEKVFSGDVIYYGITNLPSGNILIYANVDINNPSSCADVFTTFSPNGKPENEFKTKYEGVFTSVISVENDFVVYGQTDIGEGQMRLKKLNNLGKELWRKTFGIKKTMSLDAIQTIDKGLALLAYTKDYNASYIDALIIKTDENGNTEIQPKKYIKATK